MTNTEKRAIFIRDASILVARATELGISLIVIEFYRSPQNQARRYARGRTKPGRIITYCDGYKKKSKHQFRLAWDIAILIDGQITWNPLHGYNILGNIWKQMGHTWGGDFSFKDYCHFEYGEN